MLSALGGARAHYRSLVLGLAATLVSAGLIPPARAATPTPSGPSSGPELCATQPAPAASSSATATGSPSSAASATSGDEVWSFVTEPDLHPMRVTVTTNQPGTAAGRILVAPYSTATMVGQTGALMLDNAGQPVWFRPLPSANLQNANVSVQTYHNQTTGTSQPVLSFWQGTIAIPPTYQNLPSGAPEPGGCFYVYDSLESASQGNVQNLPNGNQFVGWGQNQYFSEYANAGNSQNNASQNLFYDAKMPGENISYRTFRDQWTGTPTAPPAVAARTTSGQKTVYASWNGSTQTAAWQVLAGPAPDALSVVVDRAARSGFETAISTANPGPYFQVRPLDAAGKTLGTSAVTKLTS